MIEREGRLDLSVVSRRIVNQAFELVKDLEALDGYRVLFLPLATCLSDRQVEAIRSFVADGGTVIADGRVALLTGNGAIRRDRPLDEVFGVNSAADPDAFNQPSKDVELAWADEPVSGHILEPGLELTDGEADETINGVPLLVSKEYGKGAAILLNVPFTLYGQMRGMGSATTLRMLLAGMLLVAAEGPSALVVGEDDRPLTYVEQVIFRDGDLRYLCLEHDIHHRTDEGRRAVILALDTPQFIYDVRAGKQIGEGRVKSWEVEIARGRPLLYALLPYRVTGVDVKVAKAAAMGKTLSADVAVAVEGGEPQFHVVHVDVFAPDSRQPHRQYSQNIDCPAGRGRATIPFALNDPTGEWTLRFRDVATGVRTVRRVTLKQR